MILGCRPSTESTQSIMSLVGQAANLLSITSTTVVSIRLTLSLLVLMNHE